MTDLEVFLIFVWPIVWSLVYWGMLHPKPIPAIRPQMGMEEYRPTFTKKGPAQINLNTPEWRRPNPLPPAPHRRNRSIS